MAVKETETLSQFFRDVRNDIIKEHIKQGQYTTGKTAKQIEYEVSGFRGVLYGPSYVGVLETGRKGGKVPKGFIEIIKEWAVNKRIFSRGDKRLNWFSYFTAKKIAEEGTKLHRQGGKSGVITNVINDERISALVKTIADYERTKILSEVVKIWEKR